MERSPSALNSVEIEQAIAKYVQQIADSPPSADIYAALGDLYTQQQRWKLAVEHYRQAISLKPDLGRVHRRLGFILSQRGKYDLAANHLFEAFQLQPDTFTAQERYKLGQTLETQNKPARAIVCYRSVIELQPNFKAAYKSLADLLLEQGKDERAIKVYRQGVEGNPQHSYYLFALASALAAQKKWVRASNNYQRLAKLESSPRVYYHWGIAQYKLGQYDQARSLFEQAVELKPSAKIYNYWGLTYLQLEEEKQAESCWRKAISLKPNYLQAHHHLGKLWQNQGQWQQALAAYKRVISLDSEFVSALVNIGMVYRHLKQFEQAIASLNQAISYVTKGSPLEKSAFECYQQTLNENPQATVDDYYGLGKLLRARGYFPLAIATFIESLKLDPYFQHTYIDLQYTPIPQEQFPELIKVYRQIVTEHPEITVAWGNLGDALTQQDRVEEAIECYRKGSYQQAIQTYPELAKLDWQPQKKLGPDFIIAGASKSGTSSIYFYLSRHPQILLSHKKELDFYWQHYKRGLEWYLAHFPSITDRPDFLTGEATPNYLRFPQVAQRIKNTFPQTKIILLLRNPVDRAISWHYHKLNTGLTKLDLATAIANEIERLATVTEEEITNTGFYNPDNIMSSLYIYKIKPWIEILGRKQFLILKSEDFYRNPVENMAQVFQFLDLPSCTLNHYPKVNAGSYDEIDPGIRKTLADYFAPYNQQLEQYLDIQFDWK